METFDIPFHQWKLTDKARKIWYDRLTIKQIDNNNLIIDKSYIFMKTGTLITKKNLKRPKQLKYIKMIEKTEENGYDRYYFEQENGKQIMKLDFEIKHNMYNTQDYILLSEYFVKFMSFYYEHQITKADLKFINIFNNTHPEYTL